MRIALGVSAGIAAYKAPEIVRGLYRAGADVRVLMSGNASQFVTPLTLQTLSGHPVVRDPWGLDSDDTVRHIDLTREIDAFVVAPTTANQLAKFARGVADGLLSTFYLAVTAPVVLAPSMNTRMWMHAATRENISLLKSRGVRIIPPDEGWLAEREVGVGRLAAVETIVREALAAADRSRVWTGRKVLISAGPTEEPFDPVRFLTNRSSGRMGYALAEAAARRGAEVVLVSGPVALECPYGVRRVSVRTSREMQAAMMAERNGAALIVMAAAVADYLPPCRDSKRKKTTEPWTVTMDRGPDILQELGASRSTEMLVGFAAETENLEENARRKLGSKNLDLIVANDVSDPDIGFGSADNCVAMLARDGRRWDYPKTSKQQLAEQLVEAWVEELVVRERAGV